MPEKKALSTQEVADLLQVSKSTIYDLIKRDEIRSYKVGRKVRFTEEDVKEYIARSRVSQATKNAPSVDGVQFNLLGGEKRPDGFILCGQDLILDVLSNYMRLHGVPALRAYIGSYDGLVSLYRNMVNVTAAHMWDSDSDTYNIPYVRRLLPGIPAVVVHLTCRMQGLYIAKGNPKGINGWKDFARDDIVMINREQGAGSRVLLDEHLKHLGIFGSSIRGYRNETSSHLAVASAVSRGEADVAIGNEKIARQVDNIEFIPLQKERYDLVLRKEDLNTSEIQTMMNIIRSNAFRNEFGNIGGYDTSDMGRVVAET